MPPRLALGAIATIAILLTACHPTTTPEAAIQTVRAATVEEIRPDTPERYSATISPATQIDLGFKSAGVIDEILQVKGADGRVRNVQAGDFVAEGAQLALVRRLDYEQRVQQYKDQSALAEAQLAQAEVARNQAELDFKRAANLYQSASLTRPDFEHAKAQLDSTNAQVAAAQANLQSAHNAVSQANLPLSDTSVRAPFAGWIIARNVEKGSVVGNASIGFSIVDTHVVKAIFAVPDTSLKSIRLGQRLTVLLDALPQPVKGVVTAISPQADPRTHVFSVEVSIANPSGEVRPGMIGALTLDTAVSPVPHIVVPLSAVVRAPSNPNGFAVFRLQDRGGKTYAIAQNITPGNTYGNSLEVLNGLTTGERIVGLGGELLRDGQEVRLLP